MVITMAKLRMAHAKRLCQKNMGPAVYLCGTHVLLDVILKGPAEISGCVLRDLQTCHSDPLFICTVCTIFTRLLLYCICGPYCPSTISIGRDSDGNSSVRKQPGLGGLTKVRNCTGE